MTPAMRQCNEKVPDLEAAKPGAFRRYLVYAANRLILAIRREFLQWRGIKKFHPKKSFGVIARLIYVMHYNGAHDPERR